MSDKIKTPETLTQFMDEVARLEIRAVSDNHRWTDWADWHRHLHPSTAKSFMAFREAAERYAAHREQIARKQGFDQAIDTLSELLTKSLWNTYMTAEEIDKCVQAAKESFKP